MPGVTSAEATVGMLRTCTSSADDQRGRRPPFCALGKHGHGEQAVPEAGDLLQALGLRGVRI